MKAIGKVLAICALVALASVVCLSCSSPSATTRNASNGGVSHQKEYYEGWWACSGYERDGVTVSFDKLSPEERQTFPYLSMDLEEGKLGDVTQITNGTGDPETLLLGEWATTSVGIKIDGAEFVLHGEKLTAQQGGTTLYFEKCISGSNLNVGTIAFKGISFDAPIELAYFHDGLDPDSSNYGIASSYRSYGPSLNMAARPTEAQDITELAEYFAGYEDCFTSFNGRNFFVRFDKEMRHSDVEFVDNGNWYMIDFGYFKEDPVDYGNYAETFYTTIQVGVSEGAGQATAPNKAVNAIPDGAIPWQEASQHIGETVTVYGQVADVEYASSSNGQPTFIDLGAAYPDASRVTMVIWGEDRGAFPNSPESLYAGKTLCVTGEIYVYNDACNIKVTSPSQVSVL